MDREKEVEEVRRQVDEFVKDPTVGAIRDQLGYLPIWAMMGGAVTFILADFSIKKGRIAPKSPRLALFGIAIYYQWINQSYVGATMVGMLGGVQAGLWKVKRMYEQMDPTGEKLKQGKQLIERLQELQKSGCPVQNTPTGESETKKTNKYGDSIE